jgi:hypothetical protein
LVKVERLNLWWELTRWRTLERKPITGIQNRSDALGVDLEEVTMDKVLIHDLGAA